jgi:hypothetical protein
MVSERHVFAVHFPSVVRAACVDIFINKWRIHVLLKLHIHRKLSSIFFTPSGKTDMTAYFSVPMNGNRRKSCYETET